jgi:hypothetical protein
MQLKRSYRGEESCRQVCENNAAIVLQDKNHLSLGKAQSLAARQNRGTDNRTQNSEHEQERKEGVAAQNAINAKGEEQCSYCD